MIRGRVTDGQTGEPISFAYIRVEGTHIGAACDVGGYFSILIPEEADTFITFTLIIQSVGYETQRISLDKSSLNQNIQLNLKVNTVTLGVIVTDKKAIRKKKSTSKK